MRQTVVDLLKSYGKKLSQNPKIMPMLAESREANDFLLNNKNAFLFGVIINQWIKSEKAWTAPFILFKRLGELDPNAILEMNTKDLEGHEPCKVCKP